MTNLAALPSGTELANDFKVDKVLGAGGFGITYLAHEIALDRRVTIKEYFPTDYAARADGHTASPRSEDCSNDYRWGLERFIEEAQTLAKFDHPNIVRVYRYFKQNNTGYMVLHFEEGQSFKGWLKGLGRAPRQKELDAIIEPLLEALDLIHKQDFLHRDIAPDNIIIRKDGSPVLIDFGSARCDIAAQSKTVSALVKPGYSPYEQYAETSRQQGPWTDIYALAATLYHAATGKRPPDAPSRMVNDEYRSARDAALSSYRPRFLRAIDAALTLNVDERPQSIGAWRGELLAPETAATKPVPQEKTRQGWFTRRNKKKQQDAAERQSHQNIGAPEVSLPHAHDMHVPPQPDAPGPRGGIANYMDSLKQPKRKSLVSALANVGKHGLQQSTAHADYNRAAAADADVLSRPPVGRTEAPLNASPQARTQIHKPVKPAPHALPTGEPSNAGPPPTLAANAPGTDSHRSSRETSPGQARPGQASGRLPQTHTKARAPENRRPARPRPISARRKQASWTSFVTKVAAGAGIAGLMIAYKDELPKIELAALMKSMPTLGERTSKYNNRANETGAISKRATSPSSSAAARKKSIVAREPLPANPLLSQTRAHTKAATAMAYSRDGKVVATVSKDQTLKVWDTKSGNLKQTIQLIPAPATALAIQEKLVAIGHENGIIEVFDLQTGLKKSELQRNEAAIWSLAFTNQAGRVAAASHDWKTALWDVNQPQAPVHLLEGHDNAVQAVASSPSSSYLVTGGADRRVKLWNLDTLDLVRTYPKQRDFITALAFSPDGSKFAAATLNGDISIWSAKSRRMFRRLLGHKGGVESLAFSPDGNHLTSAGTDGTVRLWSVNRGRTIKTLASHAGVVSSVGFAPDGERFASVGDDGRLRVWSTPMARGIR